MEIFINLGWHDWVTETNREWAHSTGRYKWILSSNVPVIINWHIVYVSNIDYSPHKQYTAVTKTFLVSLTIHPKLIQTYKYGKKPYN